jgi:5,10-methenyltetrahydromethanopterin hydrogenase
MKVLALITGNALVRLTYGVSAVLAPSRSFAGKVPLAPDTDHFPEARLFVRGFSSHQVVVALFGLASIVRSDLRRPAMLLAAATDLADIVSALVEARSRSRLDSDLIGGIAFSSLGFASALAGSRSRQLAA